MHSLGKQLEAKGKAEGRDELMNVLLFIQRLILAGSPKSEAVAKAKAEDKGNLSESQQPHS